MPGLVSLPRVPAQWTAELHRPALPADPAVRAAGAIGVMAVGLIHVLEIQGQLSGAAWLIAGFVLLAASAPIAGLWLLARPSLRTGNPARLAVWLGLLGWALQSFVEFVLYIPALAWTGFAFFGWLWGDCTTEAVRVESSRSGSKP